MWEYRTIYDMYATDQHLEHSRTKGSKNGIRRYQNADGTWTPLGLARRREREGFGDGKDNKSSGDKPSNVKSSKSGRYPLGNNIKDIFNRKKKTEEELAAEKKKAEKEAAAEKRKAEREAKKAAEAEKKKAEEELAAKKEKLLKSVDAKELYENKDILSNDEINARINRIDLEAKLKSKISDEKTKTGREKVNDMLSKTSETIDKAVDLYRSVDTAYSAVYNSSMGKALAKRMGLDTAAAKAFDLEDFVKNIDKKSNQEINDISTRLNNQDRILKAYDKIQKEAERIKQASQEKPKGKGFFGGKKTVKEAANSPTTSKGKDVSENILDKIGNEKLKK